MHKEMTKSLRKAYVWELLDLNVDPSEIKNMVDIKYPPETITEIKKEIDYEIQVLSDEIDTIMARTEAEISKLKEEISKLKENA